LSVLRGQENPVPWQQAPVKAPYPIGHDATVTAIELQFASFA